MKCCVITVQMQTTLWESVFCCLYNLKYERTIHEQCDKHPCWAIDPLSSVTRYAQHTASRDTVLVGAEKLGLPLTLLFSHINQFLSIPVLYATAALSGNGPCTHEIPPECPVAISMGQIPTFSAVAAYCVHEDYANLWQSHSVSPYKE